MVLDVFVEGYDESFSCGYVGFTRFRCEILRGWNQELGELYEKNYSYLWNENDNSAALGFLHMIALYNSKQRNGTQEKINKILDEYDRPYNEGMKIFANHSDCDGEITPKECVLVLDAFKRVNPDKFDNSNKEHNEWFRESYDIWIKMLKYAVDNNKSIIFG